MSFVITSILQVIALMEHGGHSTVVESGTASFFTIRFFLSQVVTFLIDN
jgi:hypothetical protein